MAYLASHHHLHCLCMLYRSLQPDYSETRSVVWQVSAKLRLSHWDHCIEALRFAETCGAGLKLSVSLALHIGNTYCHENARLVYRKPYCGVCRDTGQVQLGYKDRRSALNRVELITSVLT
ncbi:hypothetical protein F5X98DRAFT_296343 [Xylaria grammica]|nr:hypothetical protein F5X98DRAFT_296343 [Xylaria grammica]